MESFTGWEFTCRSAAIAVEKRRLSDVVLNMSNAKDLFAILLIMFFFFVFFRGDVFGAQKADSAHNSPQTDFTTGLSLEKAIEATLHNNPLILVADQQQALSAANYEEASNSGWPMISLEETVFDTNNPTSVFGALLGQRELTPQDFSLSSLNFPPPLTNFRTDVTLRYALFDRLRTSTLKNIARFQKKEADMEEDWLAQMLRYQVIKAYYGVLVAVSYKEVVAAASRAASAEAKKVEDLFGKGMVVKSSVLLAKLQVDKFNQESIQADGNVDTAYAALNSLLELPTDVHERLSDALIPRKLEIPPYGQLIQSALNQRPDYVIATLKENSLAEGLRQVQAQELPGLDLWATYGIEGEGLSPTGSDYTVGLRLTFNILDASLGSRVKKAKASLSLQGDRKTELANSIGLQIVKSYNHFLSAKARLPVVYDALKEAQGAFRITQSRYNAGLETFSELLRQQTEVVDAQDKIIDALYDYYKSYAEVLLATGSLGYDKIKGFTSADNTIENLTQQ